MRSLNIQKLSLRDYRCFEAIDIEFDKQLTVLVASNGVGKTSILDAIAVAFGPYIGAFDESVGSGFVASDIRRIRVRETASNEMEYAPNGVRLIATGFVPKDFLIAALHEALYADLGIEPPNTVWQRSLAGPIKAKTTIKDAKDLIDYGKRQQLAVRTPNSDVLLPLLAYYGTGRLWHFIKETDSKTVSRSSRTTGYTDCLNPASSYKIFVAWFKYWSTNAFKGRITASDAGRVYEPTEFDHFIASVSGAVNTCLAPAGWTNISYSLAREELVAHHPQHGELPVALLSDGIRNMIGMVADIAFRATKLNPELGARAAQETPGVVLIDEVDMHLHPEWQQVVLQGLLAAFPSVQFIVTTHSPQVLSTVRRENIRILRQTETGHEAVMPEFSPLAHESGDALARVMNTPKQPPLADLLATVHEFEQRVRAGQETSEEAIALRQTLDAAGYQIHASDLATWRFLAQRKAQQGS
jgi:predicted ATP-binding protein involved in virulence